MEGRGADLELPKQMATVTPSCFAHTGLLPDGHEGFCGNTTFPGPGCKQAGAVVASVRQTADSPRGQLGATVANAGALKTQSKKAMQCNEINFIVQCP